LYRFNFEIVFSFSLWAKKWIKKKKGGNKRRMMRQKYKDCAEEDGCVVFSHKTLWNGGPEKKCMMFQRGAGRRKQKVCEVSKAEGEVGCDVGGWWDGVWERRGNRGIIGAQLT
jgi:hypothetical protein